ncbi:MAG: signal peptidase II [Thermoanaerobaculum sp.]|nr:signal peptidase II [Thermoanaerobaculum sp.]
MSGQGVRWWPALLVLLADQLTKAWVVASLPYGARTNLIPGVCDLVHSRNRGVAFGLFANAGPWGQRVLLVVILLLVGFLLWQLWQQRGPRALQLAFSLILGGALGNLSDRLLRGEVVDFVDLYLTWGERTYHWPAFNLADASISAGALLLLAAEILAKGKAHASVSR